MKKTALFLTASIFCLSIFCSNAIAAEKFAYVDLSKVFSEYNKTKDYDKVLGTKEDSYNKERDKKVDELKKFQEKLDLLSDREREKKEKELEGKLKVLQDYDREQQTDLRKEQDEKLKEIMKDIEDAVRKYSEKEGYTFVFNDRVLVYQVKNLDITDKIIDILNKGYRR